MPPPKHTWSLVCLWWHTWGPGSPGGPGLGPRRTGEAWESRLLSDKMTQEHFSDTWASFF